VRPEATPEPEIRSNIKARNSKYEIRNKFKIQKGQIPNDGAPLVLNFEFLSFEFVSSFEIRASNFGFDRGFATQPPCDQ
jgi:hypothetical protein